MNDLLPIQQQMLRAIEQYIREHGYSPGLPDVGQAVGIRSKGHVHYHLAALERKGYITRAFGVPRSVRLTTKASTQREEVMV